MKNIKEFPWKNYNDKELQDEFNKLKLYIKNNNLKKIIKKNNVGQKCSNIFFQYYRFDTPAQNKISCVEFWKLKQEYIQHKYLLRKQHLQNTIQFLNHCPSQFPPSIAGLFYKKFKANSVIDFYGGWGDRLLASMALDIKYVGCDSNIKLKKPYKELINFIKPSIKPKIYFDKSENVIKKIKTQKFDIALSSPPFWDNKGKMLENYYKTDNDYNKFMTNSLIPIMNYCMNNCKVVCFHLPVNMYSDLIKTFRCADKKYIFTTSHNSKNKNHSTQINNYIYCWIN